MRFQSLNSNIVVENQKLEMVECFTYVGIRIKNGGKKYILLYNVLIIILNAILKWKKGVQYV